MLKEIFLQTFSDTVFPRQFVEKYELLECLGTSEQSETLLVKDFASGQKYIVKCYSEKMMQSGQKEADILRRLSHPAIPGFVEMIASDTMVCVLREYVEGITLDALRQKQELTEQEVVALGLSLCDILAYLHGQTPPVIHRDLKPQNIVLRPNGSVALIDFGISRSYRESSETDTVVVGTKGFAAPEQYGFSQTDCRSDLFSLGVVLNYLLTGSATVDEGLLPDGPLKRAVMGCVEFSPGHRFSDAKTVKAVLSGKPQPMEKRRKKRLFAVGIIGLMVLAAAVVAAFLQPSNRFREPLIEQAALISLGKQPEDTFTREDRLAVKALWIMGDTCYADSDTYYENMPVWESAGEIRSELSSLEDVKCFPNLVTVNIYGAHISDLTPLMALPKLEQVDFGMNDIADVSPLGGMERLTEVRLPKNPLEDLSPLGECPNLVNLILDTCQEYDPAFLEDFSEFDMLFVSNRTKSYEYLAEKKIRWLTLNGTGIKDLHWLSEINGLEILELRDTPLTSLAGIEVHTKLRELDVAYSAVTDFSPIESLPDLETLTVSEDMRKDVERIHLENLNVVYVK